MGRSGNGMADSLGKQGVNRVSSLVASIIKLYVGYDAPMPAH